LPNRARLHRVEVHVDRLLFALEVEGQRGVDLFQVDADHLRQHAHIDHVADQVAEIGRDVRVAAHDLLDRHRVDGDVRAGDGLLDIVGVEECPAGRPRPGPARTNRGSWRSRSPGLPPGDETILVDADGVPGGQALNVGGEQVLARDRDAHLEDGAQDGVVGGGTAGAVLGANVIEKSFTTLFMELLVRFSSLGR
jgi:hypothetical protein